MDREEDESEGGIERIGMESISVMEGDTADWQVATESQEPRI